MPCDYSGLDRGFWHREVSFPVNLEAQQNAQLNERVDAAYRAMRADMNRSLYGDDLYTPPPRPTLRQRLRLAKERAHGAWLVLTGQADIC